MKVVYEPSIYDMIFDAYCDAIHNGRQIDHIQLNEREWGQLAEQTIDFEAYSQIVLSSETVIYGIRVVRVA